MPNTTAGPIRLFALGDARIETPVAVIDPGAEMAFAMALYFLLERNEPVSRRTLESMFWPEVAPATASHRMRQTLLKLRQLGVAVEKLDTRLRLPFDRTVLDFESMLADHRELERLQASHFVVLPHFEPKVSDSYTDWLDSKKREIGARLLSPLLAIISRHRLKASWEEVESWSSALLRLAPFNEEATLALAEAHAMRGAKLNADRILDRYLAELGEASGDIRLPATVMRKRIADRMPPRPSHSAPDSPMIGRGDTIKTLSELLPRVRARSGQSCLIYGDAGIGKSRVFAEFANFAALQGLSCVRVQCRSNDSFRPLSVFVDLVPLLRAMRGAIGCSPETMKNLDRLTKHSQGPLSSMSLQGDAEFAYAKVQLAVADLIDAVADESPVLILIEDVHRLDEASANLLADLIPWASDKRILFAFTSRDIRPRWVDSSASNVQLIKLEPLDEQSSRQVVVGNVEQHGSVISEDYLGWCTRIAEGNPYFLTELARHWVQSGERQEIPPSLTAVIEQRLSMLDQPALQLLQACGLLEKNATLERIEKTLGYPLHQLLSSISELSSLGMIVLDSSEGAFEKSARLSPRHELLATAAENRLASPAKAFLHRRIGIVLESETDDGNSSAILWDSAKHWQRAGDVDRAFRVARSCATHLMELGLCTEAAQAYEKALAYCTSDHQRLEILQGQAHAYFRASDWQNLSSAASKARTFQKHFHPNINIHDDLELIDIRATWQTGGQASTLDKTLRCLMDQAASIDHRCRAGIMTLMLMDLACDLEGMRTTYDVLRFLVLENGADGSHRYEAGMIFETVCGDLSAALSLAREFVSARRKCDSIADLLRALTNAAAAARTAGHFVEARSWLNEAIAIAESHKLPMATQVPIQTLASMALDDNDIAQAKNWYNKLVALPKSRFNTESLIVRDSIGLRIALTEGDFEKARNLAHPDFDEIASDPMAYSRTYGLALLVSVQLATQDLPDEAATNLLESSHLISRRSAKQGFATFALVTALRRKGKNKKATQLLSAYLNEFRREASPAPLHILDLFESFQQGSTRRQ